MISTQLERELKLGAGPGFRLPQLAGVDGVAGEARQEVRQDTVYYDTADLRLARWGCSLRYRAGEGWTVKTPAGAAGGAAEGVLVRGEHTFTGPPRRPPPAALDLVRAYVRRSPLQPVARLRTLRRRVRLQDALGSPLAEVVDDEVTVLDGRRVAARFRELEVELRDGAPDGLLAAVLERLRASGAGAPDPTPKHVRALGPRASAPPEVAPAAPAPDAPAREVIRGVVATSVHQLLRHDPGVRLGGDPEDVHQARVATRRLRSDLRTFTPLLEAGWVEALRSELAWIAAELGAVRDGEVLLERLRDRAGALPAQDQRVAGRLLTRLADSVRGARDRLVVSMRSERYLDLVEQLVVAASTPACLPAAEGPARELLPPLAAAAWRRLRRGVEVLPQPPTDADLHQIRILAKRARYAAEAVATVAGDGALAFARAAAALQTVLGEHQDAVNALAWLRSARPSGRQAFVAGQLAAMERVATAQARAEWQEAWKPLVRKKLRGWMPA